MVRQSELSYPVCCQWDAKYSRVQILMKAGTVGFARRDLVDVLIGISRASISGIIFSSSLTDSYVRMFLTAALAKEECRHHRLTLYQFTNFLATLRCENDLSLCNHQTLSPKKDFNNVFLSLRHFSYHKSSNPFRAHPRLGNSPVALKIHVFKGRLEKLHVIASCHCCYRVV